MRLKVAWALLIVLYLLLLIIPGVICAKSLYAYNHPNIIEVEVTITGFSIKSEPGIEWGSSDIYNIFEWTDGEHSGWCRVGKTYSDEHYVGEKVNIYANLNSMQWNGWDSDSSNYALSTVYTNTQNEDLFIGFLFGFLDVAMLVITVVVLFIIHKKGKTSIEST